MTGRGAPRALAVSAAVYRLLLRACPAGYRREYGAPMAQAFRDLAREAYRRQGARGLMALWLRLLPDACSTARAEHILALKERRAITNPELAVVGAQGGYIMRSTLSTAVGSAATVGTLVAGAVSVWPIYALALSGLIMRALGGSLAGPLGSVVITPAAMWAFPAMTLLAELGRYLALSALGILLAVGALAFGPRRRLLRVAEGLTLLGILALPWATRYQAPVVGAPGHVVHIATQPGPIDGVVKAAQGYAERIPSTFTLLGWSGDGVLYYEETVSATQATRTWAYTPRKGARPQLVAAPTGIVPTAVTPREGLLELVRARAWPASAEPGTRPLHIREDGLDSPDGNWAAVVTRHIYGPEDVIVVALE